MALLSLLLFLSGLPAAAASSGTVRIALIEHPGVNASMTIGSALDRLIKESSGTVVSDRALPCYYSGSDFRFKIPDTAPDFSTQAAVGFDAPTETALVYPPIPEFVARLKELSEDPATFPTPWSLSLSSCPVTLFAARTEAGDTLVSAFLHPDEGEGALWHSTVADLHHVRWRGRDLSVVVVSKVFGGLGRLATAAREARARGEFLGLADGGVFGDALTDLRGPALADALAGMGLQVSGVGGGELRAWPQTQAYRLSHPDSIQFTSANLVYSTAPATTLLPDHVVVRSGGLRVAVLAVTNPYEAKYLKQGGLKNATIADPLLAVSERAIALRKEAGAVVLIADLAGPAEERLRLRAEGVDLIVAEDQRYRESASPPEARASQENRGPFDPPLWVMRRFATSFNAAELSKDGSRWSLVERHRLLDDSVANSPGFREFDPRVFGITASTEAPLLPSARSLFGFSLSTGARIDSDKFWTMSAGLLARETRSEVGLLREWGLGVDLDEYVPESIVRVWLRTDDQAQIYFLRGARLRALLDQAAAQREREAQGLPIGDEIRFTAGGIGQEGKIHGQPIDDQAFYKVATSQVLADALGLSDGNEPQLPGGTVDEIVLKALRARRGSPLEAYRSWMAGRPVDEAGFWKINFRDVGLTLNETKVVRSDDFNGVPNSRIQGFDQRYVGGEFKVDADYLAGPYKWSNTLEMEYARTRLAPRDQPVVTNTTANRIMALTIGTRKVGELKERWLAQSWGPSLGLEYDGEFEATPGLRRKNIYSALPGLQFYDGSFIRTLEVSANIKRDESRTPPNTQGGLHFRTLFSQAVGQTSVTGAPIDVQGEVYANYFFLTRTDTAQDLRLEGDANLKLKIPIRKYLTIAPFVDFYFFEWKLRPLTGYSAMSGIQIGFSRLWKPQFEPLFGD